MLSTKLFGCIKLSGSSLPRSYATVAVPLTTSKKKKLSKGGSMMEKRILPVETDAKKLTSLLCGSNILKEGQDIELKPDSEYPDWLWKLNTGKPPPLEEMDPETKEYWFKVRKMAIVKHNKLMKLKQF
ncbi:39S ribosomal protein L54, mitochondrial [Cimex lectularius]|uniref:Large ribosomal subunit protein mL54 n=1 Tax=Cimex lectularius TaxID=79782 RepID=A0A8I6RRR2_CIMLE|nr:39S ribosomal protein L54, mitochondrial [Cimex lectularius]